MLTPLFNGLTGEIGVMAALASDRDLVVELYDSARPSRPWTARPASADREVFSQSLDGALSCAVSLIVKAVREDAGGAAAWGASVPNTAAPSFISLAALARATAAVISKAARLLNMLTTGGEHRAIGWRLDQSGSLLQKGEADFRMLSGGTHSYLADPFPFQHEGRHFIFVGAVTFTRPIADASRS